MNYHIARDGQLLGIFHEDDVRRKLQAGDFHPTDLGWAEGMSDWQPLAAVHLAPPASELAPVPIETADQGVRNPYAPPSADVSRTVVGILPLASRGQRFGAAMLDFLMQLVCVVPIFIGAAFGGGSGGDFNPIGAIMPAIGSLGLLALLVYNLVLLTTQGQTIGKKWVGIRIVNFDDQGNPGFVKAVLLRVIVNGVIAGIPFLGLCYALTDILFIFREDRRCIHDLLAGTKVVQDQTA